MKKWNNTGGETTLFAIKRAFNHFLAKAKEEDLVIIYFAGHGASEPDEPSNWHIYWSKLSG